ncbi:hypothetical protein Tco_0866066 [Tanacetum coccineum]
MSSDNASSAVTYTSVSSDLNGPSWGIPLVNADELPEMDPYEEIRIEIMNTDTDSIINPDEPGLTIRPRRMRMSPERIPARSMIPRMRD